MAELASAPALLIGRFFAWWGGELAGLIPASIRARFFRGPQLCVLEIGNDEIGFSEYRGRSKIRDLGRVARHADDAAQRPALPDEVRRLARGGVRSAILLPPDQALHKVLTLPLMAPADLRDALAFQIDRQTPFAPDSVYFNHKVQQRDLEAKRLTVELVVAPRAVVERAVAEARGLGFTPAAVGVAGADSGSPFALNLLPPEMAAKRRDPRPWLAIVAVLLVVGGAWLPTQSALTGKQRIADALTQRLELARQRVGRLQALKDERDRLIAEQRFLRSRKAQTPKTVLFIEEMSRVLPDHTWLFHLQRDGSRLQLSGYTSDASSLIGLIGAQPMFADPKFGSPVTRDPRQDKDRFNLIVELVPGSPAAGATQ